MMSKKEANTAKKKQQEMQWNGKEKQQHLVQCTFHQARNATMLHIISWELQDKSMMNEMKSCNLAKRKRNCAPSSSSKRKILWCRLCSCGMVVYGWRDDRSCRVNENKMQKLWWCGWWKRREGSAKRGCLVLCSQGRLFTRPRSLAYIFLFMYFIVRWRHCIMTLNSNHLRFLWVCV